MTIVESRPTVGRPSRRAEKEQDILAHAQGMLREQGAQQFSMRKLADRMGMRLGHLQYYYPQLPELLVALYHKFMNEEFTGFREAYFETKGSKKEKLVAAMEFFLSDPDYMENCIVFFSSIDALAGEDRRVVEVRDLYRSGEQELVQELVRDLNPDLNLETMDSRVLQIGTLINGAFRIHRIPKLSTTPSPAQTIAEAILTLAAAE